MSEEQTPTSAAYQERYAGALMNAFGPPKLVLERGEGAHVWDLDGKEYVDLLGGIAVNLLGHAHPRLVEAVTSQLGLLGHVSNFFTSRPQVDLAEALLAELGHDGEPAVGKVFFTNSGTEAVEAAFKLTRRTGRTKVVVAQEGFHGRTMGALALTSKEAYRAPFEPLPGDVVFVPYADEAALAAAVDGETAAVLLEPIQGEAGVNEAPEGYLAAARRIADEHGALLWLDEIQTGMGRTGRWFAHQHDGVRADIVTLAKGLGAGFPIGACIGLGEAGELFEPGNHGTTFGGNPVACAAGLAVVAALREDGLMERAVELGARLREGLLADPRVTEVRGRGLLLGLTLTEERAPQVFAAALEAGFILNPPTPRRIRFAPPLVLTEADVESFLAAWPGILDAAYEGEG